MRIGVYINVLQHKPSGIGWHVINLLHHLAKLDAQHDYFLFYRTGILDRGAPAFEPPGDNFRLVPVLAPDFAYVSHFGIFDRWLLPRAVRRCRLDVFHGPNHYLPPRCGPVQVVTIHDLAESMLPIYSPQHRQQQEQLVRRTLRRADHVIAISQCTRDDLLQLGCTPRDVSVIYQGGNTVAIDPPTPELVAQTRQRFGLDRPYILFVGSLVARKNVALLLHAFALLRQAKVAVKLVLGGADDSDEGRRLHELARQLQLGDDVVFTGYLDNQQVRGLYGGAAVAAIPSLYEGFGMTALEAMAYNLPLVSTRGGSLPEVIGDAGLLVDVDDAAGMADALRRVLQDRDLAATLRQRGQARLRQFSWSQTAQQTLQLYERLAATS